MINEIEDFQIPTQEDFLVIVENLFSPDDAIRIGNQRVIYEMKKKYLAELFVYSSLAIQQPKSSMEIIFNSLLIIKDNLQETSMIPLAVVRGKWISREFSEARESVKIAVTGCVSSEFPQIREQAAHCIAIILIFECEEWKNLITCFVERLVSNTTSGNEKFGIISTFTEIFQIKFPFNPTTPVNVIPNEFYNLGEFLVLQIATDCLPPMVYSKVTKCLYEMIQSLPQFFRNERIISRILSALEARFAYADLDLFRQFHHLMLLLIKMYYDEADSFMGTIFILNTKGFKSEFNYVSIDFWSYIYLFEKTLIDRKTDTFHIFRTATKPLTNLFILDFFNIDEHNVESDDISHSELTNWTYQEIKVLRRFCKIEPEYIFDVIKYFIDDLLKKRDSDAIIVANDLAFLNALSVLCIHPKYHTPNIDSFVSSQAPLVVQMCFYNSQRIILSAMNVLKLFIKNWSISASKSEVPKNVFLAAEKLLLRNETLNQEVGDLLKYCAEYFIPKVAEEYFPSFLNVYKIMTEDPRLMGSNCIEAPFTIMIKLFEKFCEYQKFVNFRPRDSLKTRIQEFFRQLLVDLRRAGENFSQYQINEYVYRSSILCLMGHIISYLQMDADFVMNDLLNMLVKIIRYHSEYIEEVMHLLSIIFYKCPNTYLNFCPQLLQCMGTTIMNPDPRTIGAVALTTGDLFVNLKSLGIRFKDEPIEKLFELLLDPKVDNRKDYYAKVVFGIALMISGLKIDFPFDKLEIFIEKISQLARTPVNPANNIEKEEASNLFEAISFSFSVLIDTFAVKEAGFDERFCSRKNKSGRPIVVEYLKHLSTTSAFADKNLIIHLQLLSNFIKLKGKEFNIYMQNPQIKILIKAGQKSKDIYTRESANNILAAIHNL